MIKARWWKIIYLKLIIYSAENNKIVSQKSATILREVVLASYEFNAIRAWYQNPRKKIR